MFPFRSISCITVKNKMIERKGSLLNIKTHLKKFAMFLFFKGYERISDYINFSICSSIICKTNISCTCLKCILYVYIICLPMFIHMCALMCTGEHRGHM